MNDSCTIPSTFDDTSVAVTQTAGQLRIALAAMGHRAWNVAPHLRDDEPLPQFATGADLRHHPAAVDAPALDLSELLKRPIANPLLRSRNQQIYDSFEEGGFAIGLDWRTRWGGYWLATIQDQIPCQSCWAFSTAALVETMVRIEHGFWAKRSEGDLRDGWGGPTGENWIVRDGPKATPCAHGAGITGALDWVTANGLADPDCYPWSGADMTYAPTADRNGRTVRVGKYVNVGSVDDTKKWLDAAGPLIAAIDIYPDFGAFSGSGVYSPTPTAAKPGSHYVLIVGYDDSRKAWIIRNSYGANWGSNGYGLFAYGVCNIDTYAKLGLVNTNPDPWTKRRLHTGNFFESGNGAEHRNFEMLRGTAPRVRHQWRDIERNGFAWHDAGELSNPNDIAAGTGCVGQPAATATTYNRNFEVVYRELTGRLRHWWMDQTDNVWRDGGPFGPQDVEGYPAFIQSNFEAPGNFEVVVRRRGGQLAHWWRDGSAPFAWHDGGTIADRVRMSGPSLVQANVGKRGHFYVVCVTVWGTLQLWWRDNDFGGPWRAGEVFGRQAGETPVCMIQGQYGTTSELSVGNFELCVAVGGRVQHWWRDNSALTNEVPRADVADPRFRDGVYHVVTAASHQTALSGHDRLAAHPVRADITSLLADDNAKVSVTAQGALGNAALSPTALDRWHLGAVFGHDVKHVWGLMQSSYGCNLELMVEKNDGSLQHCWRDGDGWHEGAVIDA